MQKCNQRYKEIKHFSSKEKSTWITRKAKLMQETDKTCFW